MPKQTGSQQLRLSEGDRLRVGQIVQLYWLVHGRNVDKRGLTNAVKALRRGTPLATLVTSKLTSREFLAGSVTHPETARDIDQLFRLRYGKEPPHIEGSGSFASVAEYTARLLTLEEMRHPTPLIAAIFPDGIDPRDANVYRAWLEDYYASSTDARLETQTASKSTDRAVVISFLLLNYRDVGVKAEVTLASLKAQSCQSYEVIAVGNDSFCRVIESQRFKGSWTVIDQIDYSSAFNVGIAICRGAFSFVLDPGVRLMPDAVLHLVSAAAADEDGSAVAVLADSDMVDAQGRRSMPRFATGWDAEASLCLPGWGPHLMLRTKTVRAVGGARATYSPFEREDLALRMLSSFGRVTHIPRLLYSSPLARPAFLSSVAWKNWRKAPCWRRLITDHLAASADIARCPTVIARRLGGAPLRIAYNVVNAPLVSIIIPIRDKVELLRTCIGSILRRTRYRLFEILIVNNRSKDPFTLACLADYSSTGIARVLEHDFEFNWGAINNRAVRASRGEVVLFLNNDTKVIDPSWLTELVAQAMRPEVGIVGTKLLYPDGTVQHAGLIFGPGAQSYHRFRHMPGDSLGYRKELAMVRQVSAVTGACLAMRRTVFEEVGGIEEYKLRVTWSDADLCFRVAAAGYRVICTPYAPLVHLELGTRGPDDTPERRARVLREQSFILKRWPGLLGEDPCFNPNLHLGEHDTSLASRPRNWRFGDR